jgi:hypothetical protein
MPISTIGQNGLNAPLSLTSPALGTPSSLVLTNATGLPQAGLATGVAGTGPAFYAYSNSAQTLTSGANTKVLFGAELFDTNNNFASSRFTPTVAGYYQINACIWTTSAVTGDTNIIMYQNGQFWSFGNSATLSTRGFVVSSLVYCNGSTDYIEIYSYSQGSTLASNSYTCYFNGCLVRGA